MPRVLLCAFDVVPSPTGTSRRVTDYLKALNGRFSVVAMTTKTPDVSHIERYQGARLLRVPVGAGDLVSKVQAFERAVRRQLESEEFNLAHYFDPFAGYTLAELRADYGYRLLYEAHAFPSLDLRFTQPQLEGDRRFLAKVRRQVTKDYLLFPLLSGPWFLHTLTANATANLARNLWSHSVIMCGHFPEGVQTYEKKSIDGETRGEWYLRQMLGSANISGNKLLHFMTGNLSFQIEHHLFPDLPSNRYQEIAPKVHELFERYGLTYVSGPKFKSSSTINPGAKFQIKLTQAGTIHYFCSIHPFMKATIVVTK